MTITRLNCHPVLCYGLCCWLLPDISLGLFSLQDYGVFCGFRGGAVEDYQNITEEPVP
jgi:hypothetical protein